MTWFSVCAGVGVVTSCRHEKETITNESVGRTQTNYAENRQIVDLC